MILKGDLGTPDSVTKEHMKRNGTTKMSMTEIQDKASRVSLVKRKST